MKMAFIRLPPLGLTAGQFQEDFFQTPAVRRQLLQTARCRQPAFGQDQHLLADRLHLAQNMTGQDDRVGLPQLPDEFADLDDLRRVQADGRLIEDDEFRAAQQRLRDAHPLPVALGEAADEPGQNLFQPGAAGCAAHLLFPLGFLDALELGRKVQIFLHRHLRVKGRLLRQITDALLCCIGLLRQRVPRHRDLPAGSGQISGQDVHDGGLARTIRPQQAADAAVYHCKGNILYRQTVPVFFGKMRNFDHK